MMKVLLRCPVRPPPLCGAGLHDSGCAGCDLRPALVKALKIFLNLEGVPLSSEDRMLGLVAVARRTGCSAGVKPGVCSKTLNRSFHSSRMSTNFFDRILRISAFGRVSSIKSHSNSLFCSSARRTFRSRGIPGQASWSEGTVGRKIEATKEGSRLAARGTNLMVLDDGSTSLLSLCQFLLTSDKSAGLHGPEKGCNLLKMVMMIFSFWKKMTIRQGATAR